MAMYFRTFNGYIKKNKYSFLQPPEPDEGPGLEVVYSWQKGFNNYCFNQNRGYHEYCLRDHVGWEKLFEQSLQFMSMYDEIGCATFESGKGDARRNNIITEYADFRAYKDVAGVDSFFIIYNAMPSFVFAGRDVKIGNEVFSLQLERRSIIVWNLDKYADLPCLEGYTVWGIKNDLMVGQKNKKRVYLERIH